MKLVNIRTGDRIKIGDKATLLYGAEVEVLRLIKPKKSAPYGFVECRCEGEVRRFYPSAIRARWEDATAQKFVAGASNILPVLFAFVWLFGLMYWVGGLE